MESFLSLFDPSADDFMEEPGTSSSDCNDNDQALPPEPQVGNIEYKLKIINPTKQRFERLVTQVRIILTHNNITDNLLN